MAALAGCCFPGQNDMISAFTQAKSKFDSSYTRASALETHTKQQIDEMGALSADNLDSKILEFEQLLGKMNQYSRIILDMNVEKKEAKVCCMSMDSMRRTCTYGLGAIVPVLGLANDFSAAVMDECDNSYSVKVSRGVAGIIFFPFIFGVEKKIGERDKYKADVGKFISGTDDEASYSDKTKEVNTDLLVLQHRKEALVVQACDLSSVDDNRLLQLLYDMAEFAESDPNHTKESAHHQSVIALAKRRQGYCSKDQSQKMQMAINRLEQDQSTETSGSKLRGVLRFRNVANRVSQREGLGQQVISHHNIGAHLELVAQDAESNV